MKKKKDAEKIEKSALLVFTKVNARNASDRATEQKGQKNLTRSDINQTSIGERAQSKGKLNVIRIEDNSKNSQINTDENSQNIILVSNTNSRNIKLNCGKNSKTKYIEINNSKNSNEIKREITLEKDASLNFYNLYAGKGNQKSGTTAELRENSNLSVKNIFLSEKQEHNHDIKVFHRERNSKSNLQSRGILSDSKIILKGLIKIEEKAEESEGYQKSDILILNNSEAVSIPDLEIHNNKVKCSHGSSISRLDKEKIFYLQTRGLNEHDAKYVMMNAFFSTILSDLEKEEEEELSIIIDNKLSSIAK